MYSRYFVGLSFYTHNHLSKKILGFKKRFNGEEGDSLRMSLLAPFDIRTQTRGGLIEELLFEADAFYYGSEFKPQLSFSHLDIHSQGKHNILYLEPLFDQNLKYFMESIQSICESYIPEGIRYKKNKKQFFPLGDFTSIDKLHLIMQKAHSEFNIEGHLHISGIHLFEKRQGEWISVKELKNFTYEDASLLHANII